MTLTVDLLTSFSSRSMVPSSLPKRPFTVLTIMCRTLNSMELWLGSMSHVEACASTGVTTRAVDMKVRNLNVPMIRLPMKATVNRLLVRCRPAAEVAEGPDGFLHWRGGLAESAQGDV